jgi:uncharacterized protein (DUF2236 family)
MNPSSISSRINAERLMLLGWSRAILLQLAHPLIAAGVAEHSSFREGRLTAAVRLHHTIRAMLSLTFGGAAEREAAIAGINAIHRRVHGTLVESVGRYPAGTPYSAEDPQLLLWVHATLLESIPMVYDRVIAPLSSAERDEYCRETAPVVRALGAEQGAPGSWHELQTYMERTYAAGDIVVGRQARELGRAVLGPPLAWAVAPAARVNWLFGVGLLPPLVREQYGFDWTARDDHALVRWTRVLQAARHWSPAFLALWPEAR